MWQTENLKEKANACSQSVSLSFRFGLRTYHLSGQTKT